MIYNKILLFVILFCPSIFIFAQEQLTANTLKLNSEIDSPSIAISEMKWLAGQWLGEDMGGLTEEVWSFPKGDAMMGVFRFIKNEKTVFYELMTIRQEKNSLILRLKHFNPNLTGWEEKDKTFNFRFVAKKNGVFHFEGMTFKPEGKNKLTILLAIKGKDGNYTEEIFTFKRANTLK